ncbi:MAG TPA: 50S ribosomal protein L36 [Candidatus Paceibacterota bacterium]
MQIKAAIRKRCANCRMVKRRGHLYIFCRTKPRHKQKQA